MSLTQKCLCYVFAINNVTSLTLSPAALCSNTSYHSLHSTLPKFPLKTTHLRNSPFQTMGFMKSGKQWRKLKPLSASLSVPPPLDLTENNVRQVLVDAREELGQIFDTSVGMTGKVELVELDGPFVKISLKGRFWHKRSTVLARVANYMKQRIPEILEVDIEDEKQLDDSPENF
ncbi:hypothetical protein Lal_00023378 [Lupinus albus]|uniref:Putative Fe-S cluster assembly domain-containing protein n=1 Tax=Lupinus albus TaxID=3870 RepID=A0A6A4NVX6_LUPAL|nr:putative Fe-S cluster assembly domain-containing protein [Lupinus albus]KAF1881342.1 hypothetical protein Lal_00023378 [Lupinus albus]